MSVQKAVYSLFKNGYAVLPSFLSSQKCDKAVNQIDRLIDQHEPKQEQLISFALNQDHYKSDYFLNSASGISFFLEEKAFKDGKLVRPKRHSINKIGHSLHQKNQIFSAITYQQQIQEICRRVGNLKPVVVQSMAILKPPEIGGEVPTHQDSTYLYDDPQTLLAFWIPMQDATLKNGCLWGIPGSHKNRLYKRFKFNWQTRQYRTEQIHPRDFDDSEFMPIQMKKGQLAVFWGRFVHKSNENNSDQSRYAYTWHLKDGRTKWSQENWLQRQKFPDLPFSN